MGGEVIIIVQDPDVTTPPDPPGTVARPKRQAKVAVKSVRLVFDDNATPVEVSRAVQAVLEFDHTLQRG